MTEVASATVTAAPAPSPGRALWALLLGNLMIGTGFMLPIGILHHIAEDLGVTVATAGALMWAAGVTLAIGAPTMAWVTSRFDRRRLLATALAAYVVGHGASALATDFGWLLGSRLLTLVGAAIFSAQAAATVALMVPPARRAAAIAFVFIGWSVAAAATVPLTSWVGAVAGWRSAFWLVAVASAAAMTFVAAALPAGLRVAPVSLRTWLDVARDPVLPMVLAVTVTQMTGAFVLYTFIAPEVERRLYPSPTLVAGLLACFGVAGVLGSAVASGIAGRFPPGRLVTIGLGIAATGVLCVAVVPPWPALYALAFFLWGLAGFAVQSLQQARLIAVRPAFAPATAALNSAAIYLGQALGGAIGASIIAGGHPAWLAWVAFALVAASVGVSIAADRRAGRAAAPIP
ncbi:MAG: MFS transporter [Burkholderiaceae bacterium]|nr:MFS transporter [Burkholderiaceae bacterium]